MTDYILLVPIIPFFAAFIILFFGKMLPRQGGLLSILSILASFLLSCIFLIKTLTGDVVLPHEVSAVWFTFNYYPMEIGIAVDGIALIIIILISGISLAVNVYSLGHVPYIAGRRKYWALISLATSAMLGAVLAHHMMLFMMCWSMLSICLYLLFGLGPKEKEEIDACRNVTVMMLAGDGCFFTGLLLLFTYAGTMHLAQLSHHFHSGYIPNNIVEITALLLLCGLMSKSIQIPLHVWSMDIVSESMTISTLMKGTMMSGLGVYVLIRYFYIFSHAPVTMTIIVWIGLISAVVASLHALTEINIKKILVFSTIAETGFMFCAVGVGAVSQSMFHLVTHSIGKALLFLTLGSVVSSIKSDDVRQMGGLAKRMPAVAILSIIGIIALVGIPPFAGFYSKTGVLSAIYAFEKPYFYWMSIGAVFCMTLSLFRLWFLVFTGDYRSVRCFEKADDPTGVAIVPMIVLAFFAVLSGWIMNHFRFFELLLSVSIHPSANRQIYITAGLASLGGLSVAWILYQQKSISVELIKKRFNILHVILINNFWLKKIYTWSIIIPVSACGMMMKYIDEIIVEKEFVEPAAGSVYKAGNLVCLIDKNIIDKIVELIGYTVKDLSVMMRKIQTGFIEHYLLLSVLGFIVIMWIVLF